MLENMFELTVAGDVPVITSNFHALKIVIENRLKAYEIEVTEENLKQAKKDSTELSKAITQLKNASKEHVNKFSEPIQAFKAQVMELVQMISDGQEKIKVQVKKYEDVTRERCRILMLETLEQEYKTQGVRSEYQTMQDAVTKMVGISKITSKGLKKPAIEAIKSLATKDKLAQATADGRLAQLEAESLKAGLVVPISPESVSRWLTESDQCYTDNLQRIIGIELTRQEASREKIRKEEEAKAQAKIEKPDPTPEPVPEPEPVIESPGAMPETSEGFTFPTPKIKSSILVTCQFIIETDKVSSQEMEATRIWFTGQLEKIKHLPTPTITVVQNS